MGKYRIKENGRGLYIVLELKNVGGGYAWEQIGGKFESKEAAQKFIDKLRGTEPVKEDQSTGTLFLY